jgi:hypothetical protein
MPRYELRTTRRVARLQADSEEHARAVFTRRRPPPEPFPRWPGDDAAPAAMTAWFLARGAYFARWPFLDWAHGECLLAVAEASPPAGGR